MNYPLVMWPPDPFRRHGLGRPRAGNKSSFRFLHTLYNGSVSRAEHYCVSYEQLPEGFKHFSPIVAIYTSSIQYENDDLMRPDLTAMIMLLPAA